MFKKIIGTAGSKIIIAAISLLIVGINAKFLGAEGLGTIGLIVLGITIILLINSFIGGTILVYLVPREDNFKLLVISYVWAVIVTVLFWVILQFFAFVPVEYAVHVLILSLIFSFFNINLYFLLGKQMIKEYNFITTFQYVVQIIIMVLYFIILKWCSVLMFIYSLYISYTFTLLVSGYYIIKNVKRSDFSGFLAVAKKILQLSTYIQVASVVQMMNYRLSYYIIDYYVGRAGLGIFHFGNQLAEGTWVVGRSVAIVQYSGISNSKDKEYAKRLTLRLMKLTFLASTAILLFFMVLPESLFAFFGKNFTGTKIIMASLSIGILSNALAMMFSHYFAGLGKPHINTVQAFVGVTFTLALGFWLIPTYGIIGAGITASSSYLASLIYQVIIFCRFTKPKFKDFLITSDDYNMLKAETKKLLFRTKVEESVLDENLPQ